MSSKELKICIDKSVEYVVTYPNDKNTIEQLISIVTTPKLKQEILNDKENTFQNFIGSILTKKKRT